MAHKPLRILLVHDSIGRSAETRELLMHTDLAQFELDCVSSNFASQAFTRNYYNVCVIDSVGKGTRLLEESLRLGFSTPIILLVSDCAGEVLKAMRRGAADCLIRDGLTAQALEESICVVIEKAQSNAHLSECARLYLSLVEHSSEIIYSHDLMGTSILLNRAGQQLVQYIPEELSNLNFRQLIAAECVELVWSSIDRMLADRRDANYQTVLLSKEGRRIPVSVTMHLIYKDGNPVGVQGVARDMSWQTPDWSPLAENERLVSFLL